MEFEDIKNVEPLTWGLAIMLILVTIVPGLLLLYIFDKPLFMEIESIKLLFLSISLTLPFWAINTFMCMWKDDKRKKETPAIKAQLQLSGLLGAFISLIPLYFPVILTLFVNMDSKVAAWIAIGLEILMLLFICCDFSKKKSKNNK